MDGKQRKGELLQPVGHAAALLCMVCGNDISRAAPPSRPLIEAWIHHELTRRYDSAITEPIPTDLLALLKPIH